MDEGAWQVIVHGVVKSLTRLSYFTFTVTLMGVGGSGGLEGCFQLGVPWEPGRSFLRGLREMSRTF